MNKKEFIKNRNLPIQHQILKYQFSINFLWKTSSSSLYFLTAKKLKMQSIYTKGTSYPHSLSPQKSKKVTVSRLIVLKNPLNKFSSPQAWNSEIFENHSYYKTNSPERNKNIFHSKSPLRAVNDSKSLLYPLLDINKFNFPASSTPVYPVIGIKEALRDKDWAFKAKDSISRDLSSFVCASNGVSIEKAQLGYKYYLGKGNNSALIKQCFNNRWWWTEDQSKRVNLVWTQLNYKGFFEQSNAVRGFPKEKDLEMLGKSVKCSILFESDTLEEKTVDISALNYDLITKSQSFLPFSDKLTIDPVVIKSHNKLEYNTVIGDKKNLFYTLKNYYSAINENVFDYIPLTFHIMNGEEDPEFKGFADRYFADDSKKHIWIIKPGENTNRGNGITICKSLEKIKTELHSNSSPESGQHTVIIQKYIEKPFLVNKRKFDIRLYTLMTSTNGILQCYFYQEGYIRTSSKDYNAKAIDNKFIHLTNDAVQKKSEDYGKYENGNKMSYKDFQKYLDNKRIPKNFILDVLPIMKKIVVDTVSASFMLIDKCKRLHTFEIFGYDFLLDSDLRPWLLEINSNPCLELSSTILARIIPAMVENAFKIAIDPLFPEPIHSPKRTQASLFQDLVPENKFELVFHEALDGKRFLDHIKDLGTFDGFVNGCEKIGRFGIL